MTKIGMLPANPAGSAVYRRKDGSTYLRLNDEYHVKMKFEVKTERDGEKTVSWIGDGYAEKIDIEEEVEVIETH